MNWTNQPCDPYWDEACIQAKQQALLSACERGG